MEGLIPAPPKLHVRRRSEASRRRLRSSETTIRHAVAVLATAMLTACTGDSDEQSLAQHSQATVTGMSAGVSPFIEFIHLQGGDFDKLETVEFTIQAKPGRLSRPVHVTQSLAWLERQGHFTSGAQALDVPVFGLYSNFTNSVAMRLRYLDGSTRDLSVAIAAPAFVDVNGIYDRLQVLVPRKVSSLGYDYFFLKGTGSPMILDTDGELRWAGAPSTQDVSHTIFDNGGFFIGSGNSLDTSEVQLDGQATHGIQTSPPAPTFTEFHHEIDPGKSGFLAEFDADINGISYLETILAEITRDGQIIQEWDLGDIIAQYMRSQGDDPTLFVRPGTDWFHMNASLYDWRDNSVIVSSRENFLIKLDYQTGQIKWIFGDPTKYWYTFASLRAKALTLQSGLYPIGQHGISMVGDHELLLFNNGYPSFRQPAGAPAGDSRTYATVGVYAIDENGRTVTQVWNFDHGQDIQSNICGDAAQASDGSVLIDYAYVQETGSAATYNRLIGLTPNHDVAFDLQLPTVFCSATFNAQLIDLASLFLR